MAALPTLSIGIPAFNEAGNIKNLLDCILSQTHRHYRLKKIIVCCDGCTDRTTQIVKRVAVKHSCIRLIERDQRKGKAAALNAIYEINTSQLLLTLDADILPAQNNMIDLLVKGILSQQNILCVGPRHVPVDNGALFSKFAKMSYLSFEQAFLRHQNGNNFYSMMSVALMKKNVSDTLRYPNGTLSDQCYLYAFVIGRNSDGFQLIKNAEVYFRTVSTFAEWRKLALRSVVGDKADVVKHFGSTIQKEFVIPNFFLISGQISGLLHSPIYMTGSIFMNVFIRLFPLHLPSHSNGKWEPTASSKIAITLNQKS